MKLFTIDGAAVNAADLAVEKYSLSSRGRGWFLISRKTNLSVRGVIGAYRTKREALAFIDTLNKETK